MLLSVCACAVKAVSVLCVTARVKSGEVSAPCIPKRA